MGLNAGDKIGGITLIRRDERAGVRSWLWLTVCDCGRERLRDSNYLYKAIRLQTNPKCKSCTSATHGLTPTGLARPRIYRIWGGMKTRCYNSNAAEYKYYGGKGILICDQWLQFIPFGDWAFSSGYSDALTIERVDPNWHYDPSNCEWVTPEVNQWRRNHPGHYWRSMTCDA